MIDDDDLSIDPPDLVTVLAIVVSVTAIVLGTIGVMWMLLG